MVCITENVLFTAVDNVPPCRMDDIGTVGVHGKDDKLYYVGTFYREAPINERNLELLLNALNARWGSK